MENLKYFTQFISACLISIFLLPVGFIYFIIKAAVKFRLLGFLMYIFLIVAQITKLFFSFLHFIALFLDKLGNIIAGDLLEDLITTDEDTTFGKFDFTISASVGRLEERFRLNKRGLMFTDLLSKILGNNHAIIAYRYKIELDKLNKKTWF